MTVIMGVGVGGNKNKGRNANRSDLWEDGGKEGGGG